MKPDVRWLSPRQDDPWVLQSRQHILEIRVRGWESDPRTVYEPQVGRSHSTSESANNSNTRCSARLPLVFIACLIMLSVTGAFLNLLIKKLRISRPCCGSLTALETKASESRMISRCYNKSRIVFSLWVLPQRRWSDHLLAQWHRSGLSLHKFHLLYIKDINAKAKTFLVISVPGNDFSISRMTSDA